MLYCTKCGHANTAQSNFCSHCGERLVGQRGEETGLIPAVVDEPRSMPVADVAERAVADLPADNALLIVRRGTTSGERLLIDKDKTIAGRHQDADIFLDDITVSRHHAEFERREGRLFVRDLGSLNGTYVNRRLVEGQVPLASGDEVQIGKFKMTCYLGGAR